MTEAQHIATALPAFHPATIATGSSANSTTRFSELDLGILTDLPDRLDDVMLSKVQAIAACPLPALSLCDSDHLARCLRSMTILPKRADDEVTGKLRLALYREHLGAYPNEALSFLAKEATGTCTFFPSPAECKAILGRWERNDPAARAKRFASARAHAEREQRFEDAMGALARRELNQGAVDALPERWRNIADCRGYLRRMPDGSFVVRPDL